MLVNEMIIFYHVVKYKSFSQTAIKLDVSKSFVSKQISRLEKDLKSRLLTRSTRQISLTEAGEVFFQHCQTLFDLAQQGYEVIANLRHQPTGTLKISAPPALALHLLAEPLSQYRKLYPDIKLNIMLESQIIDIVQQGYDLVLRVGVLENSNLIAQPLTKFTNVLCASPIYFKMNPAISHPQELNSYALASYGQQHSIKNLQFIHKKEKIHVMIDSCIQTNSLDLILQLALAGSCIAILPEFMVKRLIAERKMLHCLPDYNLSESILYACYPEREFKPLKVSLFIEVLKKYLNTF